MRQRRPQTVRGGDLPVFRLRMLNLPTGHGRRAAEYQVGATVVQIVFWSRRWCGSNKHGIVIVPHPLFDRRDATTLAGSTRHSSHQ
jgi:hypothetical protein